MIFNLKSFFIQILLAFFNRRDRREKKKNYFSYLFLFCVTLEFAQLTGSAYERPCSRRHTQHPVVNVRSATLVQHLFVKKVLDEAAPRRSNYFLNSIEETDYFTKIVALLLPIMLQYASTVILFPLTTLIFSKVVSCSEIESCILKVFVFTVLPLIFKIIVFI